MTGFKRKDEGWCNRGRKRQWDRGKRLGIDYRLLWSCREPEERRNSAAYFPFVWLFPPSFSCSSTERWRKRHKRFMSFLLHLPSLHSQVLLNLIFLSCLQKKNCIKNEGRKKEGSKKRGNRKEKTQEWAVFTLLINKVNQREEEPFQFPIPKSNKRSLKPPCLSPSYKSLSHISFHERTHFSPRCKPNIILCFISIQITRASYQWSLFCPSAVISERQRECVLLLTCMIMSIEALDPIMEMVRRSMQRLNQRPLLHKSVLTAVQSMRPLRCVRMCVCSRSLVEFVPFPRVLSPWAVGDINPYQSF